MSLSQRLSRTNDIQMDAKTNEHTIRTLKLLSKSQTALLKSYLHGKLTLGKNLVSNTIDCLVSKGGDNDPKIRDLKNSLKALRLHEIEIDINSTEIQLHEELALLRKAVENGEFPGGSSENIAPPVPPTNGTIQMSSQDAEKLKSLEKLKDENTAKIRSLERGNNENEEKIQTLESENKKLRDSNKKLESELDDVQSQLKSTENQVAALNSSKPDQENKSAAMMKEIDTLKRDLDKKATEINELQKELSETKQELDKTKADLVSARSEGSSKLDSTTKELKADAEKRLKEVEKRLEGEKEEMMEALAQEIEEIEKNKAEEEAKLTKERDSYKSRYDSLSKTNKGLTSQIIVLAKATKSLRKEFKSSLTSTRSELNEFEKAIHSHYAGLFINKLAALNEDVKATYVKYRKEMQERKRLHNLVQELKGNIRVYMRCRPPTKKEIDSFGNDALCVSFNDNEVTVINEKNREKTWEFDEVFGPESKQEEVYEDVSALVTSVLDGFNVCIFAYGQTGSGKTWTMSGPPDNRGVNTRALEELFTKTKERSDEWNEEITVSMLEVYNEEIHDLLVHKKSDEKLEVRMGEFGNYVTNLSSKPVTNIDEVFSLLKLADKNRSQSCTNMNEHSSRSHMMMTVTVVSEFRKTGATTRGKLNLVDLAGSERINKSGATGVALKEAQNINKSLSALGDVIAARAQGQGHVPFRNSTLTYLLQDSLSQDSKTLMIVCASPVIYNAEETFCSLNFASRVRQVELGKASSNKVSSSGGSGKPSSNKRSSIR